MTKDLTLDEMLTLAKDHVNEWAFDKAKSYQRSDEIFNKITKLKDKKFALIVSKLFLNLKNLNFINADLEIINYSHSLLEKYDLGPRDAIHLACALSKGINNIISNDKDFDKISEIKRFDIKDIHKILK